MDDYDSESSGFDEGETDYTETDVLLGYASEQPTEDSISHLGGLPTWLDPTTPPPGNVANCRVCNDLMPLLLQLHGDLPEHFPDDQRWLYLFGCARSACNRKKGSIRALRAVKKTKVQNESQPAAGDKAVELRPAQQKEEQDIGATLFGVRSSTQNASPNPFSTTSTAAEPSVQKYNPFSTVPPTVTLAAIPPQKPSNPDTESTLPQSFADKVRLSPCPPPTAKPREAAGPPLPWPPQSAFPPAYAHHYLDGEYETFSRELTPTLSTTVEYDEADPASSSVSALEIKETFESSLDKAFLRFSMRIAHNPEQVLRYQFRGTPLLYSVTDAVGKVFSSTLLSNYPSHVNISPSGAGTHARIPRCESCGGERVFELQLVPHAITLLEQGRKGIGLGPKDDAGMEWGTVILGVCAANCGPEREEEIGWREEWVGVQWEETK